MRFAIFISKFIFITLCAARASPPLDGESEVERAITRLVPSGHGQGVFLMSKVLIIGCGGVANVAIRK